MTSAPSRRLNGSLGDSWGTADYISDDNPSIHSAYSNSLSDTGSESNFDEPEEDNEDDMATPLPPRTTRASRTPRDTPSRNPTGRASRIREASGSSSGYFSHTPPSSGPSFIMPSPIDASTGGFKNASPLRQSHIKSRKTRPMFTLDRKSRMSASQGSTSRRVKAKPNSQSTTTAQQRKGQEEPVGPWHYVELLRVHFGWPILKYLIDIFAYAMNHFMKPLLGTALGIAALFAALHFSSIFLRNTFQSALTPICIIPGSSYLLPFCDTTSSSNRHADFEELVNIQSAFESVLEANADSYALPANMKKSQVAIRDLRSQVKFSRLPSRAELSVEFDYFIDTAREASDALAKYNGKIGYVMDQVISTNKWTLQVLHGLAAQEAASSSTTGALFYLNPFSVLYPPAEPLAHRVFTQYVTHVAKVKQNIEALIANSEALIALLDALETRLDVIADIAVRDDTHVSRDRDLLLAQLWTKLGGNRSSKASSAASLQLLREVMRYRALAVQHVTATLLKLQEIEAGLENLREGVGAPEVLGWREDVPLQWHIEVVGRCVDRLRDVRGEAMLLEREAVRRGLAEGSGAKEGGARLEGGAVGEGPTVYAKKVGA